MIYVYVLYVEASHSSVCLGSKKEMCESIERRIGMPRGAACDVKVKITMKAAFRETWKVEHNNGLHDGLRNVFRCRSKSRAAAAADKNKR